MRIEDVMQNLNDMDDLVRKSGIICDRDADCYAIELRIIYATHFLATWLPYIKYIIIAYEAGLIEENIEDIDRYRRNLPSHISFIKLMIEDLESIVFRWRELDSGFKSGKMEMDPEWMENQEIIDGLDRFLSGLKKFRKDLQEFLVIDVDDPDERKSASDRPS